MPFTKNTQANHISYEILMKRSFFALFSTLALSMAAQEQAPRTTNNHGRIALFEDTFETQPISNFKFHLSYDAKKLTKLLLSDGHSIALPKGEHQLSIIYGHSEEGTLSIKALIDGNPKEVSQSGNNVSKSSKPSFDRDFTIWAKFQTKAGGTIFANCAPKGKWSDGAKALLVRNGELVYDIGWLGAMEGGRRLDDGKEKTVLVRSRGKKAELYLNGKLLASRRNFHKPDSASHVFKIGKGADDFATPLKEGKVKNLKYWADALPDLVFSDLISGKLKDEEFPPSDYSMGSAKLVNGVAGKGFAGPGVTLTLSQPNELKVVKAWAQDLGKADHAQEIARLDHFALEKGRKLYEGLCITCHGTPQQEGSLPTALKFHDGKFKNGSDPWSMFETLDKGYGQMIAQPQYSIKDKYALIHFIRESLIKENNPKQYFEVTKEYLTLLPPKLPGFKEKVLAMPEAGSKPYQKMDFGTALFWTYQVNKGGSPSEWNIAQKGIAVRLDKGPGGISKGKSWILYDEDTMRVAAAYEGEFVDWRGIAFDGSHGTHTSIRGENILHSADQPAWQNPKTKDWEDLRIIGRDGRKFGPLPRAWVQYLGLFQHADQSILHYRVGDREIHELPGRIEYGKASLIIRNLRVASGKDELLYRLSPKKEPVNFHLKGSDLASIVEEGDFICLKIKPSNKEQLFTLGFSQSDQATIASLLPNPIDPISLTKGGPARFEQKVITTEGKKGNEDDPFAVDILTVPNKEENPWNSWMRLGGFDFFADNPGRAAVCTWMGDVWLVDGVSGDLKELKWRRICSGLFQPLGLKIIDGVIHVTCRDQIARLHDLNGDLETDWIECFNNDHQVTEHFHEFAMGLQVDGDGNLYYAKSARHAKPALVPHHGTLLRVSSDGKRTDIVATGFRAANGVCLNPDGTWIVTDQEGHWNPKNRINYVKEGGFYGNMMGYHDIEDTSDSAMQQPLAWITNAFDRSPAELLWVPKDGNWGELNGRLLNLSYGYGMAYLVPHEVINGQAQGGLCAFPIDRLPTGIHRGRFHPETKDLFAAGMFAWAGSQRGDGGLYRIRKTENPAFMPTELEARKGKLRIRFSNELPTKGSFQISSWNLKRTRSYGSRHYDTKKLEVADYVIKKDWLELDVPGLAPTWGMEINCEFDNGVKRIIHNSIHQVTDNPSPLP
jgi:hypothetical protein